MRRRLSAGRGLSPMRGLSLIEWMITVAVALVLFLYGGINLRELLALRKLEGGARELQADLVHVRTRAMAGSTARLVTAGDGRSYQILDCGSPTCLSDAVVVKSVTLTEGLTVTGGLRLEFSAPKGELTQTAPQRACMSVSAVPGTRVQVGLAASLAAPTVCRDGSRPSGLPACSTSC